MSVAPWAGSDPRARQRNRWRLLARAELEAAEVADEPHVAEAFRIVLATIEADVLPALPVHGRQTLKGRAEIRERAVELPGRVSA